MKTLIFSISFISVMFSSELYSQGGVAGGNGVTATGAYSSAIGDQTITTGVAGFSSGYKSESNGQYSFAHGHYAKANHFATVALGRWVDANGPNSMVFGVGYQGSYLSNPHGNTLMIAFNSTKPTFFIGPNETGTSDGLGKVGLGTTTPGSLLQVNGNVAIGYDIAATAPDNSLIVSGEIGIGVITPSQKLEVNGKIKTNAIVLPDGEINSIATVNLWGINGNHISNNNTGNVGIGQAVPTQKLDVNGKIKATAIVLPDGEIGTVSGIGLWSSNGSKIYSANNGNVGIGDSNPLKKLSVNGDVMILSNNVLNALQILSSDAIPSRRGISLNDDPNGAFNFYINSWQTNAAFNFKNSQNNSTIASLNSSSILSLGSSIKMYGNEGNIWAKEVSVALTNPYPDYVFDNDYDLMNLDELEKFITNNKHLPGVPAAKDVEEKGLSLGESQRIMMEKIEELTLYILQQNKTITQLQKEIIRLNEFNE